VSDRNVIRLHATRAFTAVVALLLIISLAAGTTPPKAKAANFQMQTGYYMGTGASLAISGLGFQPDYVMIKSSTAAGVAVFKTSAMPANATAFTSATADNTATSVQLTSNGFTVGTLVNVNSANVMYYWTAFTGSDCSATGNYCVGTYTGNGTSPRTITTGFQPDYVAVKRSTAVAAVMSQGTYTGNATDNRNITGAGFVPDHVMVKNATSATTANRRPVMNISESYGDNSIYTGTAVANLTNAIQSLQTDGFQLGTAVQVNETSATFYWVAFGGTTEYSASGDFQMETGTYTGTGASLPITGIGFQPDLVIIKDNSTNYAVFRTSIMFGDNTAYLANALANFTGGVTSLDSDGFTVGTNAATNAAAGTYHWQAFGNAYDPQTATGASDFAIGAFYGNGIDSRNITRLPWQPNMVTIKRNGASAGAWRSSSMSGDLSSFFGASAEAANYVQALNSDGFQVGTNAAINTAAAINYWFAFKTGTNFTVGNYTGTGSAQNVTAPGFLPDSVWVKRSTAVNGVSRASSLSGNATQYLANVANVTDRITAFISTGFSIGGNQTETNTSAGTYRYVVWRAPTPPVLSFDIVDSGGASVATPNVAMPDANLSFTCNSNAGTLGTSSQKLRISNMTTNPAWSLSIAATDGSTAVWRNGGNTQHFDYNDNAGTPNGCSDGADADDEIGQLTLNPASGTNTPQGGCSASNITLGSNSAFQEGAVDAITLVTAASGAQTNCYWDVTNIGVSQYIPKEQQSDTYTVNLTLTITAQ
jgi:hypothetical protein